MWSVRALSVQLSIYSSSLLLSFSPGHRCTPVTLVLLHYYLRNPVLSGLSNFPIKVNQLLLTMFKLSSNIPVVLQSSQFKNWDKSIQGFLVMIVRLYKILKYYIWIRTQGYVNSYNKKIKKILNQNQPPQ